MVHELGLERRETVLSLSVVKYERLACSALVREDCDDLTADIPIIAIQYVV